MSLKDRSFARSLSLRTRYRFYIPNRNHLILNIIYLCPKFFNLSFKWFDTIGKVTTGLSRLKAKSCNFTDREHDLSDWLFQLQLFFFMAAHCIGGKSLYRFIKRKRETYRIVSKQMGVSIHQVIGAKEKTCSDHFFN